MSIEEFKLLYKEYKNSGVLEQFENEEYIEMLGGILGD